MKVSKQLPAFMGATILRAIQYTTPGDEYNSLRQNIKDVYNSGNGFVSIFKAKEPRVKFANAQGAALAITTGMLKQIVQNAVSVGCDAMSMFALMDILLYMDEIDLNALEFSVTKHHNVYRGSSVEDWIPLSDRYQTESWKKRLKMSYPSYDTSAGNLYPEGVTLAEANRL